MIRGVLPIRELSMMPIGMIGDAGRIFPAHYVPKK